jgi:hypothetical protein
MGTVVKCDMMFQEEILAHYHVYTREKVWEDVSTAVSEARDRVVS